MEKQKHKFNAVKDLVQSGFPLLTALNNSNPDERHLEWMKNNDPYAYDTYTESIKDRRHSICGESGHNKTTHNKRNTR